MPVYTKLIPAMAEYERECPLRVHHFLKVHAFAKTIAASEFLDASTQLILETAAIVHDIGIKPSLEKYNSSNGNYKEVEGPPLAEAMLRSLGFAPELIARVCYLVAHHHTYGNIAGLDYQVLIEADFLVNILEQAMPANAVASVYEKLFVTASGRRLCRTLYLQQ
jgi:HD superfamily phosphodiesterase